MFRAFLDGFCLNHRLRVRNSAKIDSVRTKTKIYADLKTQSACFRHLNATHQLGCGSSQSGNVGVVYYIQHPEDFDWVLKDGPHAPYVVVIDSLNFTGENVNLMRKHTDRVTGILVIDPSEKNSTAWFSRVPPDGFSVSDTCPNDMSGMYRNNKELGGCKKMKWNTAGTGLMREDIGIPVFALTDPTDVDKVLNKCFSKFNKRAKDKSARGYPLCAAEVKTAMLAAVDTETCLRRSGRVFSLVGTAIFCDPLGNRNVHVTMMDMPQRETRPIDSVIVVGARMDSTSLFNTEYRAADTAVAGLVSLLATMEALFKTKDTIRKTKNAKDIMFTLFQGETFDYIGSSNMVYLMQREQFPQDYSPNSKKVYLGKIGLRHINQIVELNQVGHRDDEGSLWMHTDPNNYKEAEQKIKDITDGLIQGAQGLNVTFNPADEKLPLPPASSQRFLMERTEIPVVVITDHQEQFTNKFYNSRLDIADVIDATDYPPSLSKEEKYDYITTQAELISGLSTALARYLYQASTGVAPDDKTKEILTANSSSVAHMLYCFLVSPNCELFKQNVAAVDAESLESADSPYTFYVGVYSTTAASEVTTLARNLMARFAGDIVDLPESKCKADNEDMRYSYRYVQGNLDGDGKKRQGWCIKSSAQMTPALSPAFQTDDYDMKSGKYSTWSESRWENEGLSVRLFLVPSRQLEVSIFAAGVVVLVFSMLLVYWCGINANHIFTNRLTGTGTQTNYSPMI